MDDGVDPPSPTTWTARSLGNFYFISQERSSDQDFSRFQVVVSLLVAFFANSRR